MFLVATLPREIKSPIFADIEEIWKKIDTIFIISLYLNGYTAKRFTDKFSQINKTKRGYNKQLKKLRDTGTLRSACTEENVETVNNKVIS